MHKTRFRRLVKWAIIACVVMVAMAGIITLGENSASAHAGQTSACTNCHTYQGGALRVTTDTTTKTVAPSASFIVNTSWTGGGGSVTEINWANVNSNTMFTPTPRIPYSGNGTTGTVPTTLTAPAAPGTYTIRVWVSQAVGAFETDYKDMTITVAAPVAPNISTASLPAGTVGTTYSQNLAATGGTTPYTWTISAGTLPVGLSLSTGGVISGTPTAAATSNFTVQVSCGGTATKALSILVNPAAPSITTASLPAGTVGAAYSQTLAATGGTLPRTWTVSAGSLPAGLSLSTGGLISGTPTAAATSNFTVQVSGGGIATKALAITVNPAALSVTTASLPAGTVGAAYSQTLTASGGTTPFTWSVSSGSLPVGLSLSTAGAITGTPTGAATSNFTVQVSGGGTATKALSIVVNPAALTITTASLSAGTVGLAYSQTLTATGGTLPFTWTVTAGTLPAGLSLSTGGLISGTPTATATSNFTVQVSGGGTATKALSITVNSVPVALSVTTASLPAGTVGATYGQTLAATGGTLPYTWTLSAGSLPTELSLSTGGLISGTPTAAATSNFTVQVSGGGTATKALSITVDAAPVVVVPVSVTTASPLANGTTGTVYNQSLAATGGTAPYTWTVSAGSLPTGLSLSTGGVISGTPTVAGTYGFTVRAADMAAGAGTKVLTITVGPAVTPVQLVISMATNSLDAGRRGSFYSTSHAVGGGTAPYTWSITSGSLPTGLNLNTSTGVISGRPTVVGTYGFTLGVLDANGKSNSMTMSITIYKNRHSQLLDSESDSDSRTKSDATPKNHHSQYMESDTELDSLYSRGD
jgi:hypothetical protein